MVQAANKQEGAIRKTHRNILKRWRPEYAKMKRQSVNVFVTFATKNFSATFFFEQGCPQFSWTILLWPIFSVTLDCHFVTLHCSTGPSLQCVWSNAVIRTGKLLVWGPLLPWAALTSSSTWFMPQHMIGIADWPLSIVSWTEPVRINSCSQGMCIEQHGVWCNCDLRWRDACNVAFMRTKSLPTQKQLKTDACTLVGSSLTKNWKVIIAATIVCEHCCMGGSFDASICACSEGSSGNVVMQIKYWFKDKLEAPQVFPVREVSVTCWAESTCYILPNLVTFCAVFILIFAKNWCFGKGLDHACASLRLQANVLTGFHLSPQWWSWH